jgi:hypothetical protein
MNNLTKVYVGCTVILGVLLLLAALRSSAWPDVPHYVACLALALVASAMKVKLPRIDGTYSLNFIFLLVAVLEFSWAEAILMSILAAVVQSLWRRKNCPTAVQAAFNAAMMVVTVSASCAVAYSSSRNRALTLMFGAVLYFLVNTSLVSGVLALVEKKNLVAVWRQWFLWSFPYYIVGTAIAGLIWVSETVFTWKVTLSVLPLLYLLYLYYRMLLDRLLVPADDKT